MRVTAGTILAVVDPATMGAEVVAEAVVEVVGPEVVFEVVAKVGIVGDKVGTTSYTISGCLCIAQFTSTLHVTKSPTFIPSTVPKSLFPEVEPGFTK
jgi:hypothetical protein